MKDQLAEEKNRTVKTKHNLLDLEKWEISQFWNQKIMKEKLKDLNT